MNLKSSIHWSPDIDRGQCSDCSIISIHARYRPDNTANASVILNLRGEHLVWRDKHFSAATEALVKTQVEEWGATQMFDITRLLGAVEDFHK